jgi:hypothetical protein
MGWNSGYKIVEKQVIGVYDLGILTKEVLETLVEPFRGTDIDAGGGRNLKSKDGKTFEEIVIEFLCPPNLKLEFDSLKKLAVECNAEVASVNNWENIKDKFPTKEKFLEAYNVFWKLQDMRWDVFFKSVRW